ncbi:MAG TPA: DUF1206 domain-containing protein [Paracoccaceae bacterium]|nr:DUF1206 domain-containing protein [Paracoccaceae bacterium]
MEGPAPAWVVPAMRAGFAARAVVFGLIGWLALGAAWQGGYAEGPGEALKSLTDEEFGTPLLWAIAGGAFGFAGWCLMAAALDLDCRGKDARGIFARLDFAGTGLLYIVIGVFIAQLAATGIDGGGGEGETRERGTAWLLALPAGGWIVIAVGIGFIVAGLWFGYKGLAGKYRERLRDTDMVERLDPICKFGWVAYGLVIMILGGFLVWAGWTLDPTHAGGFADVFALVREAVFGRVLLGVLAFGFMAFAVECLVEAAYRIVPARHGRDAPTLAARRMAARSAAAGARPRPG